MPQPIEHIVFDIGSVLLHYEPEIPYRRLLPDETERRWFFDHVCTHEWNIEQDRGRSWREAEDLLIAEYPDHETSIRAFRTHWHEMVPHAYEDTVHIMRTLIAQGRDITMLTNFAADTLHEASQRFSFLGEPRGVTVSADVGFLKPERAIYDIHVSSFGLAPAATLFIDDNAANVDGAKAAGWKAVRFIDPETLRTDLAAFGLSV
ncbi:MAG: HAD family phosphatase [Alphaproteobacteria bacterium]|nr:HAD family phosphatase [Alphaproteobacteria bacterium]